MENSENKEARDRSIEQEVAAEAAVPVTVTEAKQPECGSSSQGEEVGTVDLPKYIEGFEKDLERYVYQS